MNDYNELIERCKEICDFLQTGLQRINNHRYSVAALCSATEDVLSYVVTDAFACNGGKCRELLCESCFSSAKESAVKASEAYTRALNALERVKATLDAGEEAANQAGCKGENCGIMPGGNHSPECILEAAETQGWLDAPESVRAAKESLRNIGVETCTRAAGVIELLQSRIAELESSLAATSDMVNKAFADGKAEGHGDATEEASVVIGELRARVAELKARLSEVVADLEMRSYLKRGEEYGLVDVSNGVYMRAKEALGQLDGEKK